MLTHLCLCPVLSPPAPTYSSPMGFRVEGTGPGMAPGGTFSRVGQVRPGPESASPPESREAWGRGSQRGLAVISARRRSLLGESVAS